MILIDQSQIMISNLMVNLHRSPDFELSEDVCRHMVLNSLRKYNKKFNWPYGQLVVCCDGDNYWRKGFFEFYKHSRIGGKEQSRIDWEEVYRIASKIRQEICDFMPFRFVRVPGAEGDDVIASLAMNNTYEKHVIISGDHDFQQLQRHGHVLQYNPVKDEYIKCQFPIRFLKEHIVRGDVGDGIPNIKSADDVFKSGIRQTPITAKWLEEIMELPAKKFCTTDEELRRYRRNNTLINFSAIPQYIQDAIQQSYMESVNYTGRTTVMTDYFKSRKLHELLGKSKEFYRD